MTKKDKEQIQKVINQADDWINACTCGYKDGKLKWCEQYGCSSIAELAKPLRELLDDTN